VQPLHATNSKTDSFGDDGAFGKLTQEVKREIREGQFLTIESTLNKILHQHDIDQNKLRTIRDSTDWQKLFLALGLVADPKKSKPNEWWCLSPFTDEKTASFHISEKGWYCWSSKKGGGPLEAIQKILAVRGTRLNIYQCGAWAIHNKVSYLGEAPKNEDISNSPAKFVERSEEPQFNTPLPDDQDLSPYLGLTHHEFTKRGISKETCKYLDCGYLAENKSRTHQLRNRIIFQVWGVKPDEDYLETVLLGQTGRATSTQDTEKYGKWRNLEGFKKSLELYNINNLLTSPQAVHQAKHEGKVWIVEGCFDVAKMIEAGIKNVVATFGSDLSSRQVDRFKLISEQLGIKKFSVWYDRDQSGETGKTRAIDLLKQQGFEVEGFNWDIQIMVGDELQPIPDKIGDVCELSVDGITWLAKFGASPKIAQDL